MLNFLGITRHLSTTAGYAKRIGWLLREDVTQSPFPVTGVSFTGAVKTEQGDLPITIEHGEQENYLELTFPALPIGRWPYAIHAQDESGEDLRLFSGYIGAVESVTPIEASTVYDIPVMGVAIPIEAGKTIKAQWLSNTAATSAAHEAQEDASSARTDAETASKAAATATDAASTATERTKEAEDYAESAHASEVAAGNSASAASTSAAEAARDAKTASDARTEVEGIASTWSQTVSNAEQTISAAKEDAIVAVQSKQADSVLAVGRASQTAQQSVASAQSAAVAAVETAETEAVQAVKTAQATAESSIGGMVQEATDASTTAQTSRSEAESAAERAGTSATNAASSATAAQQALSAIPQVDAAGNMTLAGGVTIPAEQKITLSNGGATIFANPDNNIVHVSGLASATEISGNVVNCNRVAASTLSISTAATFGGAINANGGVNIPVAPSTDTEAARYREVRLLHEMEFSALRTYFSSSNPFSWGIVVDRFWWAAGRDNMPAWTVVTADFNMLNLDNNNSAYDGLTSCYFPMSCGLGYGRCFDSIAIGNTYFNTDYASLDDDPFTTPAGYMRYWIDIQISRPANGQCAVSVRMSRWDNASSTAVNTTHQCSVPDSLALRGVALSMTSKYSGVWLVGFNKSAGRLVSYKVLPETFTLDSYNRAMSSRLSLAKTAGHCSVGVHAPCYYGGTVLGEWCDLIQIN